MNNDLNLYIDTETDIVLELWFDEEEESNGIYFTTEFFSQH